MRSGLVCIAAVAAILGGAERSQAAPVLAYSFEAALDGFFGLGGAASQSAIGVTDGASSLEFVVGVGGFVGVRTETVIPPALNDPPGVTHVLFDLTVVDAYAGGFADIGITVFGHALNAPGGAEFGHMVQFADTVSIAALGVGTHAVQIALDQSVGAYRPLESFNDIFGPGATDLTVASAFQFFISKNVLVPVTVYIDNVRLESGLRPVPEPASLLLLGTGAAALVARARRRRTPGGVS